MTKSPVIPDLNTRFALPIVCPTTGEHVSAETLYNRCCAALGHVLQDHIGDLILDNLSYGSAYEPDLHDAEMCKAIYAWAASVREQIAKPAVSLQAAGRLTADHSPAYPWRVVIMAEGGHTLAGIQTEGWSIYQVFEEASEGAAIESGETTALEVLDEPGVTNAHYYVGEVA
jgi:hypothetical protein